MTTLRQRVTAGIVTIVACGGLVACGGNQEPEPENKPEVSSQEGQEFPDAATLDTDFSDPDSVAKNFVTIIESHNAAHESTEWASLARAEKLMVPSSFEANMKITEGDVYTDWDVWRELKATTRPVVKLQDSEDKGNTATRTVTAAINVNSGVPNQTARSRHREHTITLTKQGDKWLVDTWKPSRLGDSKAPQAGER